MNDCYALRSGWSVSKTTIAALLLPLLAVTTGPVHAADFYWDQDGVAAGNGLDGTGLGGVSGVGIWDGTTANWWDLINDVVWPNTTPGNTDRAFFTYAYNPGVPTFNTVTLSSGIVANQLRFLRSGYTLSGGDLTLDGTAPGFGVNFAESATISSQIMGNAGLTKTGGGTLRLTNTSNNYTGTTSIDGGILSISNQAALGSDPSAVVVNGSASRGFGGGALLLEGGYSSGIVLSRGVNLQGQGPTAIGSALISVGNNSITGALTNGAAPLVNTAVSSAGGRLALGDVTIGGTSSLYMTFGAANGYGTGSYAITGALSGVGNIQKTGGGTLILSPSSASGFSGIVQTTGGSTRVSTNAALGTSSASNAIDLNGGIMEIRTDSPDFSTRKVNLNNGGTLDLFADRAVGGAGLNQTVSFANIDYDVNEALTINSRNGYNVAFTAATAIGDGNNNNTFTNSGNGLVTYGGTLWGNTNTTARTLTINGTGNTLVTGSITTGSTALAHIFTKGGTGTVTVQGTSSNYLGQTNINNGALVITDFRSVNNNTAVLKIGASGTGNGAGVLTIGTATAPSAAGLTTSKVIDLGGTTGGATINASQSGTNPVKFNAGAFTASGAGSKTLTLGGTNTADNIINSVIVDNLTGTNNTSLTKTDLGTWVLAGSNTYSGTTTISGGTLKLKANAAASTIIKDTSAIIFNANTTAGSAGGTLQFTGVSGSATTEDLGALTPTAGAGTVTLMTGGGGAAANLTFGSLGATTAASSVNFITIGGGGGVVKLTGQAATTATDLPGTANFRGHLYLNGADFAAIDSSANVVTPTYSGSGAFQNASTALIGSVHNQLTGSFTNGVATISSLKLTNQTLSLSGTLTMSLGAILQTGGTGTIQSDSGTARAIAGGSANLAIRVDAASDVFNLGASGAPVNFTGTAGMTKNGAGTLVINGVNAQTGTTTINEGTVRLGANSAKLSGNSAALVVRQGAVLDLNGQSSGTAIGALDGGGTITNSSATAATLVVGNATTGAGTFAGIIEDGTGVVNVSVTGTTGSPVWSGLNTYTGVTTIGTGLATTAKLVSVPNLANYGTASSIGRGIQTSVSDANNAASLVFGGLATAGINYTGTTSVSIDRLFTLNGNMAGAGAQIANASANNSSLIFNKANAIAFGAGATMAQTLTLGGSSTGDNQINLQINDNGSLATSVNKIGAGQWILGNTSNGYTGTTTVTEGKLVAQDGTSLPNASWLLLGGTTTSGVFQSNGDFTRNIGTSAAANTVTFNSALTTGSVGFAAQDSKLVVALGGLASPTVLTWGSGGFMGVSGTSTGAFLLSSSTAQAEVEIRNAIDLNGGNRTIQVDDNANTYTDFATITGAISGTGGLTKTGAGTLQLFGANTYSGATAVTSASTLVVNSLGLSTGPVTVTSVGSSANANLSANAVSLGSGTNAGILQYVGPGEISDRMIQLNTTTGSTQIHADGSGPLILTNVVNDTQPGNKLLYLRGSNTQGNAITSTLADYTAGTNTLGVVVDGGATWIFPNANSYTGTTDITGGALGAGNDVSFSTSTLRIRNGAVFAYGSDRTLANPLTDNGTTTAATATFIGDYSVNLTSPTWTHTNTTAGQTISNGIVTGKTLTIGGDLQWDSLTGNVTQTFTGPGDTILNGSITTIAANNVSLAMSGPGSLTINGIATANAGNVTISGGTLKLGANERIPDGSTAGNVTMSPALGATATLDLNGKTETINGLTANAAGTTVIDNTSATPASLTFGTNNQNVDFGSGSGTYTISNSGGGALSIKKTGSGTAAIPVGSTLSYQGTTTVDGGSFSIASAVNGTIGLSVTNTSTLALTGGITNPGLITSVEVGGGSTLTLLDGAGSPISNLTSLSLGLGAGTAILNLNVGDGATDTFTLLAGGTLALGNTVTFNMTDAGLSSGTTYTLLNLIDGGISAFGIGNMVQGATPGGFSGSTWNVTDKLVQFTTGTLITGNSWWNAGGAADNWSDVANWSVDLTPPTPSGGKAGTNPAASIPGPGTDVFFIADNITGGGAISTTLEQNLKINSLTFEASSNPTDTPSSVTIAPGVVATNRLEVAPQAASAGVAITAGGPAAVTISAPLKLGKDQTWNVADATSTLTLSGGLFGEKDVTKSGSGKVIISAAADSTFNTGQSADFTVNGGNLEFTNSGALGTAANSNLAKIVVNSGGFYYNNATGATLPHAITLSGGTLSAGSNNHTYSSVINVTSASTINMADSNGAPTATARNITLSGGLTGTGNLTVNSNSTAGAGNEIGGILTINQDNSAWSGNWNILRGTVSTNNVNGLGSGTSINFEKGKIALTGTAGSRTIAKNVVVASATGTSVGELNFASGIAVDVTGQVTLGGAGGAGELRVYMAADSATATLSGGVLLANNGGLGTQNAATRLLDVNSVISQTGGACTLTINDATWGGTAGIVRLSAANTYTGGTNLARGTLQMNHVSGLSSGALNATGASTLNSLVDLTGANALANALNLSAVLTFTGTNGVTFNGTTTNIGAGGITNSLTAGNLLFDQVNLAETGATAARTLTIAGASTGTTTITSLLNNDQNNILTNNLIPSTLTIGTIALSESAGTGRILTLGGTGNTEVTGLIEDVAGGSGTAGTLAKADAGVLTLQGANTFTGPVSIAAGVLEFGTVTNVSGGASNLGNGSAISMSGGTLRFIGSTSQSTNRPITTTGGVTLAANGTGGATITYTGAISQGDNQFTLTGTDATTSGFITGGVTQTGTAADLNVNSGNWTLSGSNITIADNVIVTGANAVLNLNQTGILNFLDNTNYLYIRTGATVNLGANEAISNAVFDGFLLGDNSTGGAFLNTNTFSVTGLRLDIGNRTTGYEAQIDGTGTVLVNGTGTSDGINAYRGIVNAKLASAGNAFEKYSPGTVTLRGDNSGLTTASNVYEGTLVLDYTSSNTAKLATAAALDMRGGILSLLGNNGAATSQTVGSFTLASGGSSTIRVTGGTGRTAVLNLGAITRGTLAQDGTVRFILPSGTQSSTNGVTTTSPNSLFGLLGTGTTATADPAYATVDDGTGVWFATRSGTNIVALASTPNDAVGTWVTGDHITDNTGFTGTVGAGLTNINSLRFNAASGSDLAVNSNGILIVGSGGVLVTSNVGGTPSLTGGTLASGAAELVITQDSAQTFEIGSGIRIQAGVTKAGTGTLKLSGSNDFWGQTEIQEGTLQVSGGTGIGDNSLVTLATYRQSTLQLLANETIGRLAGGQRSTESDLGLVDVGTHTLTVNQSADSAYAGLFAGSGTIILNAGSTGNFNYSGLGSDGQFTGSVITNGGLFQISGNDGRLNSATAFTINGRGSFLLDNNADTNTTNRVSDSATFTLNSASGALSGTTIVRGLANRNNDNDDAAETVGATTFNSGANYVSLEASGGTSAQARIVSTGWTRNNAATVNARGRSLGATSDATGRTQFKVTDANDAAMLAANVGGGGTIGGTAKNVSIIPWAIGENLTGSLADGNMGNTFLSYVDNRGFVPLSLSNEYATFGTAAAGDNVRESLNADLTGLGNATVNSLVIDNQATTGLDLTGLGSGYILQVTSGAMLFTVSSGVDSTAYDTTLGGFDGGITVGSTNEYVFHVVNPSSALTTPTLTASISSPLTSTADITKSGRGTLILSGNNINAGGGSRKTTLNEGALQIADLDNIGGNTGAIVFAGGTLRFGAGLTDDVSIRPLTFLLGGGTVDTNGVNLTLANAIGNGGPGGFTKAGAGTLTLSAAANWQGSTTVSGGTLTLGHVNAITSDVIVAGGTLNMAALSPTFTNLTLGPGSGSTLNGSGALTVNNVATLHEGTVNAVLIGPMNLIKRGAGLTANLDAIPHTYTGYTWIQDGTLSVSALANLGALSSPLGAPASTLSSPIYLGFEASTGATLRYTGAGAGSTDRPIILTGTTGGAFIDSDAAGLLTMNGEAYGMTPGTKALTLQGTNGTAASPNIYAGNISDGSAVLGLTKLGTGTWALTGTNTYTGSTTVSGGVLNMTGSLTGSDTASTVSLKPSDTGSAVINVDGDISSYYTLYGTDTSGVAVYNQASGTVSLKNGTSSNQAYLSNHASGYGYLNLTGGSLTIGGWLNLAKKGTGVAYIGGTGTLNTTGGWLMLSYGNADSKGALTIDSGGALDRTGATSPLGMFLQQNNQVGVLNLVGGRLVTPAAANVVQFGNTSGGISGSGQTGILNLAAGVLETGANLGQKAGASQNAYINLAGGSLKATANLSSAYPLTVTGQTVTTTVFGSINNTGTSQDFTGGFTVDSNSYAVTLSNPLLAASGYGVTQGNISIPGTGNLGYEGAPFVEFSAPAGGGVPASGYAKISGGQVSEIVITAPGTYAENETPMITLTGGGGSISPFATTALTTANTSGGLTKTGLGTLTLTGANTYTGVTSATGGVLNLNSAITSTSGLSANGGIINVTAGFVGGFKLGTVSVGTGSSVNFLGNAADDAALDTITVLSLGAGSSGVANLGLELGADASPYDRLVTGAAASVANTVNFDIVPLSGFGAGTYTLLSAASGLNTGAYSYSLPVGYSGSLTATPTDVQLVVSAASGSPHSTLYWLGGVNDRWGSFDTSSNSNWTNDEAGTLNSGAVPDSTTSVIFRTNTTPSATSLATTLVTPFTIKGLVFNGNVGSSPVINSISIDPGVAGALTIGSDGINMQTGAPAAVTISAPLTLGAPQAWTIADSGTTLTVGGVISGATANGSTALTVNGGTFNVTGTNNNFSGDIVVNGASTVLQVAGSNGSATGGMLGYIVGGTTTPGYKTVTLQNGGIFRTTATFNNNVPTTALPANGYIFVMGTGGGVFDVPDLVTLSIDDGTGATAQLQGTGSLTKTGLGTLVQDDSTAFAGEIIVTAGSLQPSTANAFGATSAGTTIQSGARLNVNGITMTNAEPLTIHGTGLAAAPAGALTNASGTAGTWVGPVTLGSNATIGAAAAGSLTLSSGATVNLGAHQLTAFVASTGAINFNGIVSGVGGSVITAGAGTGSIVFGSQSTYNGGTTLGGAGLVIPTVSSVPTSGTLTSGPFGTGTLTLNGARIRSTTTADMTVGNNVTIAADTTFVTAASEKNLVFTGPATLSGGTRTLTVDTGTTVAGTAVTFSGAFGDGGGGFGLTKAGTGTLVLSGSTINYTGPTTVSEGTLNLAGSAGTPLSTTSVTVASGATLNLVNGAGQSLGTLTNLNLGAGSGIATLGLELGAGALTSDGIVTSNPATALNAIQFNITALSGFGSSLTYDLLTASSGGLTAGGAAYSLGYMPGGYTYTLTPSNTLVQLGLTPLGAGTYYWRGDRTNQSWAEVVAGNSNWSTDLAGTADPGASPGALNTVIFSSTAATGPSISTTLDNNYFVNNIQFTSNPAGVTAVNIAPGAVPSHSLTIAPATATDGIDVADNAGTITISAPVVVGSNQEWDVSNTSASLLVSGALSGSADLTKAGAGQLTLSGSTDSYSGNITIGAGTLNFAPTGSYTVSGLISGSGVLRKSASGTITLSNGNTYLGATNVDEGSLLLGTSNALPTGTVVRLGTATTAGTLDLNGFDQTIASLTVESTSNSVTNQIVVDTGNTLTINGAVILGIDANASDTNINALGGGSIVVNSGGANFIVGAATGGTNDSRVDADFSGLTNFTVNLGAGIFRLGDVNTGTENNPSTFKLAVNNTVTASAIRIGDGAGGGYIHTLTLGSGTNLLNADTLNIGSAGSTIRSGGAVVFAGGDTTGSLTLRASDGTGRATLNMINTTGNTGSNMDATLNLAGHTADLLASTLTMASRTQGTGAATATLSFDQGTLDVITLNMASRTSTGTGGATATLNLGDSAAPDTPTATIGALNMAVNTSAGGTVLADLNVTGGNVTIGTGSGIAVNMANAGASRTVTSTIDLTGGIVDVTGNIVRTGGAGTENATVTLAGSTLNMHGNSIGTAGSTISFVAQSGTLQNLGELNGGGALTKTTTGVLILEGTNNYSGDTTISGGTLKLGASGVVPDGSGKGNVVFNPASGTATLDLGGFSETINGLSSSGAGSSVVDNTTGTGPYTLTVGGNNAASTFGGTIQNSSGTVALTKTGTGTLTLSGANTYDGQTTISQGVVNLSANTATLGSTAAGTVVQSGAQLRLTDTNFVLNENLTLSGSGTNSTGPGNGALGMQVNSGVITYNGLITIDGGATLGSFNAGTATMTVAQGITGTGDLTIRPGAANNGTANWYLNGQSSYTGNTVFSTANVNGTATIRNGIDNALPTGSALLLNGTAGSSANTTLTYVLNGYNQTIAGLSGTNGTSGAYTYENTVVGGSATLSTLTVNNTADFTFGGTLGGGNVNDNNLALTKDGAGTLVLSGANTYAGGTTVSNGTLLANNTTASATGSGAVNVTGGTLGGTGTIGGSITVGSTGRLTAGTATDTGWAGDPNPAAQLSVNGNITGSAGAVWLVNLVLTVGGDASGGKYVDLIGVTGDINPTNFTLQVADTGTGFQWGDKYRFASYGSWTNDTFHIFNGIADGGTVTGTGGTIFTVNYADGGSYFTLQAVPEPEVWLPTLLVLALGLFPRRRSRMTKV